MIKTTKRPPRRVVEIVRSTYLSSKANIEVKLDVPEMKLEEAARWEMESVNVKTIFRPKRKKVYTRGTMLRNLAIVFGLVFFVLSAPASALDCRAYQTADLRFESYYLYSLRIVRENKELVVSGYRGNKYREALTEALGEALNEYADEYIRIHFQEEVPEGIDKVQALRAPINSRELCPGRTFWNISLYDTWLAYNSLCRFMGTWVGACKGVRPPRPYYIR